MKAPMISHSISRSIHVITICCGLFICACEKSDQEILTPDILQLAMKATAKSATIQCTLMISNCLAGGTSISVEIDNPEQYSFLWEVNGSHGGHGISTLPCICGDSATVYINRLSDGISVKKSIALTPCTKDIK